MLKPHTTKQKKPSKVVSSPLRSYGTWINSFSSIVSAAGQSPIFFPQCWNSYLKFSEGFSYKALLHTWWAEYDRFGGQSVCSNPRYCSQAPYTSLFWKPIGILGYPNTWWGLCIDKDEKEEPNTWKRLKMISDSSRYSGRPMDKNANFHCRVKEPRVKDFQEQNYIYFTKKMTRKFSRWQFH